VIIIVIEQAEVRSKVLLFMCVGEQNWRRECGAGEHLSRFWMQECLRTRLRLSTCRRHQGSRTIQGKIKKCSRNTFELNVGMEVEWKRLEDQRNEPLPDNARLYLLYYCASAQSPDELLFSHSSEALKEKWERGD
jgi:hypothetical protein